MIDWFCALFSLVFLAITWAYIGLEPQKLVGIEEDWHEDCNLLVRGKLYNGRKTYYLLSVRLYRKGFMHSTWWM